MPSEQSKRLAQEIHARRAIGLARKSVRKRLPRQQTPKAIEAEYAKQLLQFVSMTKEALQPLLDELPSMLRTAAEDQRFDAGEGKRIRDLMLAAKARIAASMTPSALEQIADRFASTTAAHQRVQLTKQLQSALGADPFINDRGLVAAAEAFTAENVALITNIPEKTLAEIEGVIQRGVQQGKLYKDLAEEIEDRFRVSRNRSRLIARDQINKYYGKVQETRQRNLGVDRFIWRTANDERVRPEHQDRDGRVYSWASAPEGGPGAAINCRCFAEPVLDFIDE